MHRKSSSVRFRLSATAAIVGIASGICLIASAPAARAQAAIAPAFSSAYTLTTFAGPTGLVHYAGMTFLAGSPNTIIIGGNDDSATAPLYAVNVTRDTNNHITGFGTPQSIGTAPNIDNGLVYGPGGNLYYTSSQAGKIGVLTLTGSGATLAATAVGFLTVASGGTTLTNYEGGLSYLPNYGGTNGGLAWDSYHGGGSSTYQYLIPFTASTGTGSIGGYTLGNATAYDNTAVLTATAVSNEGWTDLGGYAVISSYPNTTMQAWTAEQYGLASGTTETDFATGVGTTVDGSIDPVTGDALYATYSATASANFIEIRANAAPEPTAVLLGAFGVLPLLGIVVRRRRSA